MVVLPPPEGPTRAILSPGLTVMFISSSTGTWSSGYSKLTWSKEMAPFTCSIFFAFLLSLISGTTSMISWKRSIPVIPRWNCSANSMILRMVVRRVVTYMV